MAGIYIHIPFCKSRCIYCDFFSTTRLDRHEWYVKALCRELAMRRKYLGDNIEIQTIYIGGGTPSLLTTQQLSELLDAIYSNYDISSEAEITMEANPSDITASYAKKLNRLGFNRISLGIQTFNDSQLKLLHRRHTASQAVTAVEQLQDAGFNNISIDLMYGIPQQTLDEWEDCINKALELRIQHLSAYALMYEEGTQLYKMRADKRVEETGEELSRAMYDCLIDRLCANGFIHYEISNFALPGYHSHHNSSYWDGTPYLGAGAGAHSYDGTTRHANVCDIDRYIQCLMKSAETLNADADSRSIKAITDTEERLTDVQRFNETIMTRLRTMQGLDLEMLRRNFTPTACERLMKAATPYINNKTLILDGNILRLDRDGIFVSNDIISSLFADVV